MNLPTRTQHIVEKIDRKITGFNGSLFIHVDYVESKDAKQITKVQISEKGKDGSTLDHVLTALGDKLTEIIRREINAEAAQ